MLIVMALISLHYLCVQTQWILQNYQWITKGPGWDAQMYRIIWYIDAYICSEGLFFFFCLMRPIYSCCKRQIQFLKDAKIVQFVSPCLYSSLDKSGYQVNSFLVSRRKHMLWVLIRSAW